MAVSRGTPLLRSVASVRAKREMASRRSRLPKMGALRAKRSHTGLPFGLRKYVDAPKMMAADEREDDEPPVLQEVAAPR